MRHAILILGLLALLAPGHTAQSADAPADFLGGKDLAHFEGLTQYWTVRDGALVGMTVPDGLKFNTFLCSKKKYRDFELRFQVLMWGKTANSGVQIRSELEEKERFTVKGPQCDMGQIYWGSLYGERFGGMMKQAPREVVEKALKKDDYNDYHIRCVGKHVTIKLNGETTVDDDFPNLPEEGIIAWQLHAGGPMAVTFRNIQFTDLSQK